MARISTATLARASSRHPWRVLGIWLVVLVLAIFAASGLGDALTSTTNFTGKPESQQGAELLEQRLRGPQPVTETVIVRSATMTIDDAAFREVLAGTSQALLAMDVVASAPTYFDALAAGSDQAEQMVSADRHATIIPVTFSGEITDVETHVDDYMKVITGRSSDAIQVMTVGDVSTDEAFGAVAERDLKHAEMLSMPATIVILVLVFGALVAVGVPLALSIISIIVALGLTAIVGRFTDLSFYVINMITMIGLAVGIDYTLFIVSRYCEERRRGHNKYDAIEIAGGTATKAVVFSGGTVVLALCGMFLIPLTVFHSLGAGAVLAAIVAVAGTTTLVPAILGLLGDRIDWPRRRRYDASAIPATAGMPEDETFHAGFWGRLSRVVMARPALFVLLSFALLIACALPYLDIRRGAAGVETLPDGDVKTAYQVLGRDFSQGLIAPVEIVVDGDLSDPAVSTGVANLRVAMAEETVFGPSTVIENDPGDLALIQTPLQANSTSSVAVDAVWHLRKDLIPAAFAGTSAHVYVSGGPAFNADYYHIVDSSTPLVFAFVLGLSFILLLLAFRSVVVAFKAIVMNLLSVGAAYGLLVLVFQKGYGAELLGFQKSATIETWVPIFLFCVLFGLSMDYHVFLLSRIREHYDATGRNGESVAVGLQSTARIITGAAAIMVVVFGGFATGNLVAFQQMGFGMAVAIFLDATVVRTILVPAAMAMLGDRNWYLPRWLAWLPDLSVEGTSTQRPVGFAGLQSATGDD